MFRAEELVIAAYDRADGGRFGGAAGDIWGSRFRREYPNEAAPAANIAVVTARALALARNATSVAVGIGFGPTFRRGRARADPLTGGDSNGGGGEVRSVDGRVDGGGVMVADSAGELNSCSID